MTETNNLENHFLIAMPNIVDPYFSHAVVYICEHSAEGTVGLVVNRPMSFTLGQVFSQIQITCAKPDISMIPVLAGGPLQQERGFVLHHPMGHWRSSVALSDNITITTSRDILQAIADEKGPKQMTIILGYSSWGAGQLEEEISENIWLVSPANTDVLFNLPFEDRWTAAAQLLGVNINLLSSDIGHG